MKRIVGELKVRLPFVYVENMVLILKNYMKNILTNKLNLEKGAKILSHECSVLLHSKLPEKREDPRSFTLQCYIGDLKFDCCLCGLGASANLMSFSVSQLLSSLTFKPCNISLILADRSVGIS